MGAVREKRHHFVLFGDERNADLVEEDSFAPWSRWTQLTWQKFNRFTEAQKIVNLVQQLGH